MSTATTQTPETTNLDPFQVEPHNHQRNALWLGDGGTGMCTTCGKVIVPVRDRTPLDAEAEQLYREEQWT